MEISEMKHEDIQQRLADIQTELASENADVDALSAEVTKLEERESVLRQEAEEKRALMEKVTNANLPVIEERKEESKVEVRKEELYDALAETIKGRATPEQRALLTTNATNGTVAVSTIVDGYVWRDWNDSKILSRIRKSYVKGMYAVQYEASATGAVIHEEGANAPQEETLTLGTINFIAQYFKKWIKVSDSVLALRGREFLDYLFDEFGHQLAVAMENAVVTEIATSTLTAQVTHAIDTGAVLAGFSALSDEASRPVAIMAKATYADIMNARGSDLNDPFAGLEVLFNNTVTGVMVGDLDGIIANFPEGEEFKYIVDEYSLAEANMVKIVGKILCSIHLVRPNGFAHVTAE